MGGIDFEAIRKKLAKLSGGGRSSSWKPKEGEEHSVRLISFPDNDFMYGYKKITSSNITEEIDIYENSAPILYNYYITNHGECGYGLPRRFVNASWNGSWNASRDTLFNGKIYGNPALITSIGNEFNYDYLSMFYCDEDMLLYPRYFQQI